MSDLAEHDVRRFRHARWVFALSMLIMGACGIIYEYALGALGNNLIGSSHEQIFIIIGLMMFAMGIGAALQSQFQNDLLFKFLLLELLLGVLGGSSTLLIYTSYVFTTSYLVVMYGLAFVIGVAIGLEIPLLIRINADYAIDLRTNLSQTLFMDYVGALLGALLFTYVLLTQLSLGVIAIVVGLANTLVALIGIVYFWPLLTRFRHALFATCVIWGVCLCIAIPYADDWTASLQQRTFRDPIVYSETSKYQHLVLTERRNDLRLYINGHLQFSSRDEFIYHELLVHIPMTATSARKHVLILGGGDGLALREVLRYPDVASATVVDIDPAMIDLATTHPTLANLNRNAFRDARVTAVAPGGVHPAGKVPLTRPTVLHRELVDGTRYHLADVHVFTVDADQFVRNVTGTYDVVLIDLPDPKSIELAKLYSVEFYVALAQRLAPGAVLAVQSTSPQRARDVFTSIGLTLRRAGFQTLPYHDYLPSFGDWGWWLAWRHEETAEAVRARIAAVSKLPVETRYLNTEKMRAVFAFGQNLLQPRDDLQANTQFRPVLIHYYQQGFQ